MYCCVVVQGIQGKRGITGVPGPKGEAVSVWSMMMNKSFNVQIQCELILVYAFYYQGLPGPDGREGIPGMPGAKVEHHSCYFIYKTSTFITLKCVGYLAVWSSIRFCFSLSVSLQGDIGKAGVPGEVGLQGLPVSVTFDLKLSRLTLTGCTWVNSPGGV